MDIHPNNTLAQYITNLPRRISLHGEWECGLTEIHYPHDWYNVRNARMVVAHEESVHNVYLEDGYYDSPETLVEAINLDTVSRVKISHDSVTKKVRAHLKSQTKFRLYGDLSDILGFSNITSDADHSITLPANSVVDLRRGFESLYVYSSMVEPRVVGDKIVPLLRIVPITGQQRWFRARTVYSRDEPRVWNDRNRDKGRHWPTGAIRTGKGDGDTTLSTTQHWPIQMNYDDYYTRQVGGALPYFTVQRGHGFGSLFSGLLRSVAPLIKRGALALGKGALTTGAQIAGDVVSGQNIKKATKRRATAAGRALMSSLLATPPPPGKRIKRTAPPTKRIKRAAARRRTSPTKRQRQRPDVFS